MTGPRKSWGFGDYWDMRERNFGVYSVAEQDRISRAKICVVGLGCVGELEAVMLCRIGVRRLVLVDYDSLELSNLNRNPYSTRSLVGNKKVENMASFIRSIDPSVELTVVDEKFSFSNGPRIVEGCTAVLQAVDDMVSRVVIHRVCYRHGIPCVTMSGAPRFRFFVSTIVPSGEDYETFMDLPTRTMPDDELLRAAGEPAIRDLRDARAQTAVSKGAVEDWGERYLKGERKIWAVTPERPYITSVLAVRECMKIALGTSPVSPPNLIVGDLDEFPSLVRIEKNSDKRRWRFEDF